MPVTVPEDLLRELAPQVLGAVVRYCGDFDAAEDAVQEALLTATQRWPDDGVPDNPRGWLIQTAVRRFTDAYRAERSRRRREEAVFRQEVPGTETALVAHAPRFGRRIPIRLTRLVAG